MSDPDARPRPDLATDGAARPAFRLLLAHNPKIAPLAEQAGFDCNCRDTRTPASSSRGRS